MNTLTVECIVITTRMLRPLAAGALALGLLAATPAAATPAVAAVVGTGTISPGLPSMGCAFQSVNFSGTVVLNGTHGGIFDVTFNGTSSICETLAAGSGAGTLSGGIGGTVIYTRSGNLVSLSGNVNVDNQPHTLNGGNCHFEPTSVQPTTTYALQCTLTVT